MIMEVIKNHIIPNISKKNTTKEILDAFVRLYQIENNLKSIKMTILFGSMKPTNKGAPLYCNEYQTELYA